MKELHEVLIMIVKKHKKIIWKWHDGSRPARRDTKFEIGDDRVAWNCGKNEEHRLVSNTFL
jgi:hypothetical protein